MNPNSLAVLGATRGVGLATVQRALNERMTVRAVVRPTSTTTNLPTGVTLCPGDVRDPGFLREALAGCATVAVCLGLAPTQQPVKLFSDTVRALLALETPPRILLVTKGLDLGGIEERAEVLAHHMGDRSLLGLERHAVRHAHDALDQRVVCAAVHAGPERPAAIAFAQKRSRQPAQHRRTPAPVRPGRTSFFSFSIPSVGSSGSDRHFFRPIHGSPTIRQVSTNASSGTRRRSRPLAVTKVARWSKAVAAISASGRFKPVSRRIRAASSAMAALTGTR